MNPIISIIVPVYQAQETIDRCLESIVSSTAEIEIICIDDGSKDNSLSLLKKRAENDKRLKIIHQPNSGPGVARNNGLAIAKGEFIMFCDADDTYLPDTIDLIVSDINNYNPDYIVFHRRTVLTNGNIQFWGGKAERIQKLDCTWSEYLNNIIHSNGHGMGVVTKVYRKSIIDKFDIKFAKFRFGEDLWFNLTYLIHCNSFVEDYRAYYQQYQSIGSICLSGYKNYLDLNFECVNAFKERFPSQHKQITRFITNYYFSIVSWGFTRVWKGIDAKSFSEKMIMTKEYMNREDVREIVTSFLHNNQNASLSSIRDCNDILHKNIFRYSFRTYYLPKIKSFIKEFLKIKK